MSERLKKKIKILVVLEIVALIVVGLFLNFIQGDAALDSYKADMKKEISNAKTLIEQSDKEISDTEKTYDEINNAKADSVAFMAKNDVAFAKTDAKMRELKKLLKVDNLMLVDAKGNIVAAAQDTQSDFRKARFNQLKTVLKTGKSPQAFEVELENFWYRYYSSKIDDNTMVVIEENPEDLYDIIDNTVSINSVLKNISMGAEGFVMAVSGKNYVIDYHPDKDIIGTDGLDAGISVEDLENGKYTWMEINGEEYYCGVSEVNDNYYIGAIPKSEIESSRNITIAVVLFSFFIVTVIIILYGILLIRESHKIDEEDEESDSLEDRYKLVGGRYYNKFAGKKLSIVVAIGMVAVLAISFYMQTLFGLSNQSMTNDMRAKEVKKTISQYQEQIDEQTEQYNERYLNKAEIAAYIIDKKPSLATRGKLQQLADVLQIQYINVFNKNGVMTKTSSPYSNFTVSDDPKEQSYEFNKLLQGVPYVIQEAQNDEVAGEFHQYIGVTLRDKSGDPNGFVQVAIRPHRLENIIKNMKIDKILDGVKVGADGFAFAVDKKDKTFAYYPEDNMTGKKASEFGITKDVLKDGYSDYLNIKSNEYFVSSVETDDYYVYVAVPASEMMAARTDVTIAAGVLCFVFIILIFLVLTFGKKGENFDDYVESMSEERIIDVEMPDGSTRRTETAESRWSNIAMKWGDKTSGQQIMSVLKWAVAIVAIGICILVIFRDSLLGKESVFNYIIDGGWEKGVNIFSFTSNLIIISITMVVTTLARELLKMLSKVTGARGETVCRLASSFLKYIAIIAMLYMCFAQFGVDTATLLASAGILSIAISFGAKELVADILCGLFIIFEGEFRVGDIIMMGTYRGTVVEIGVRTTKIEDGSQNVKIVRNSQISDILNMTKKHSYAWCDVGIEYGESLERIENILEKEFPNIREHLPAIQDGPFYKGVVALADNSVNIRVMVLCREGDRIQLERDLNREMKLIFDKYNINIPFPQVVINQPIEFEKATAQEQAEARKFMEEQKEKAKHLGNEDAEDDR